MDALLAGSGSEEEMRGNVKSVSAYCLIRACIWQSCNIRMTRTKDRTLHPSFLGPSSIVANV